MKEEFLKFRATYTVRISSDPFWACAVPECQIPYPHKVGMTEDRKWQHVFADFYLAQPHGS